MQQEPTQAAAAPDAAVAPCAVAPMAVVEEQHVPRARAIWGPRTPFPRHWGRQSQQLPSPQVEQPCRS
eukprot:10894710-Prorocentrum_lima.AAC.1